MTPHALTCPAVLVDLDGATHRCTKPTCHSTRHKAGPGGWAWLDPTAGVTHAPPTSHRPDQGGHQTETP